MQELIKEPTSGLGKQMKGFLLKYLEKQYPDPDAVDLLELCQWPLWPTYFKVFGE